ncbi:hypothetical protein MMC16_007318 [Acarospora aff. strigata]|nr:hypothetical protein [Acarospora aff. strigata]
MATASFLGLPPEVRLFIYELIFSGREVALIDEEVHVRHNNCHILQVCRQTNREAEPIIHRTTLYIFGSPDALTKMANQKPLAFFFHLRRVKLDIWLPSHGHLDYRGFCHLTLSQWGTALRLLYLRRGRRLKHLTVVCRGPTYGNHPPYQEKYIHPWSFRYSSLKGAIVEMVKAEKVEFSGVGTRRDSFFTELSDHGFVAKVWHL